MDSGASDRCSGAASRWRRMCGVALAAMVTTACGSPYYTSAPIEAWVVDAETGAPIEGAVVTANWQLVASGLDTGGRKLHQLEVMEAVTDKAGRFYFPGFTRINFTLEQLKDEDPQLLIFKSGYRYARITNDYTLATSAPRSSRAFVGDRTALKLSKSTDDLAARGAEIAGLSTSLSGISNSGDSKRIPNMIRHLYCEREKLARVYPSAGNISIPGATSVEIHCGKL